MYKSGGSYHNPNPLSKNNHTIHECDTYAKYLIDNGIPEKNIFKEWCSYDTIGNAYFTKLLLKTYLNGVKYQSLQVIFIWISKVIFDYIFDYFYRLFYLLQFEQYLLFLYMNQCKNKTNCLT